MADTVRVSVRLPQAVVAHLDKEAQANYLTRSDVIRRVLGLYAGGQQAPEQRGGDQAVKIEIGQAGQPGQVEAWPDMRKVEIT
jgi:metal-responsive CopG/Arc/MetJ family transcriptional regulator